MTSGEIFPFQADGGMTETPEEEGDSLAPEDTAREKADGPGDVGQRRLALQVSRAAQRGETPNRSPAGPNNVQAQETTRKKSKDYTCEICQKSFRTRCEILNHSRRHMVRDEKTYPCELCPKKFLSFQARNQHLANHPHECHVCRTPYSTVRTLTTHLWKAHGIKR